MAEIGKDFIKMSREERRDYLVNIYVDHLFKKGIEPNRSDKILIDTMVDMHLNMTKYYEELFEKKYSGPYGKIMD